MGTSSRHLPAVSLFEVIKYRRVNIKSIRFALLWTTTILLSLSTDPTGADDSASAPALDMNALASLASNLGSNPQIMSMVSSLLNPQKAGPSSGFTGSSSHEFGNMDQDSTSADTSQQIVGGAGEPLKRGVRQESASAKSTATQVSPPSGAPNLSGLMSLLPNMLPNLNLNNLGSLIGQKPAASADATVVSTAPKQTESPVSTSGSTSSASSPSGNSAQQVINQILKAYASGQIPNELIQLGLSGRVPPQIIELALSGQVPAPMIQMVITGQVPMQTINAFLASSSPQSGATEKTQSATKGSSGANVINGPISTTRAVFEALFKPKDGSNQLVLPTLLGPMPINLPSFPNVRKFGQIVGSSISNMASMIP